MKIIYFPQESSNSWSPESCVSVARIAKHCYQKLLGNLRDVFHDDCSDVVIQSRLQTSPRSNLSLVLGNGLRRCLRKTGESWKRRHDDPEVGTEKIKLATHIRKREAWILRLRKNYSS